MYDIIVVGARCAGSSTALLLARKGYRVLLLDKTSFPSDTMSGHVIHPIGGAKLKQWNLLDQVVRLNCPPITEVCFDFGTFSLPCSTLPVDGVAAAYEPRRYLLDTILVHAAVEAGADLREGFRVQELLMDDGQVVGVRGKNATGQTFAEKAKIIIGADGLHSLVARQVNAPTYWDKPTLSCSYYTYWSGMPLQRFELYPRDGFTVLCGPTNDQLTFVAIQWSIEQFPIIRTDVKKHYLNTLGLIPQFAERLQTGKQEERFVGTGDQLNFFRKASGPGWALVGDAGYHKDPILGHGMSDAFRDAELLAEAINSGFSERCPLSEALSAYEQRRNEIARPIYELNSQFAAQQLPSAEMLQILEALRSNAPERARFLGVIEGSVSPAEFFAPEHVAAMLGVAER